MAEVILDWFDDGLNSETFFIVGHSLGAQMSAIIGRSVAKKSSGEKKIARISALDPALPSTFTSSCINKNDAKFVDIIHTDAWLYGTATSTGHADFWPNGGKSLQPGCPKRSFILSLSDIGGYHTLNTNHYV